MSERTSENNRMGHAPLFPLIWKMALPAMFSMLIQALYNIVDSYFVSQISTTDDKALSALSLAFPVQNLMVALAVGTSVGASSLIARRLGEGKKKEAENAAVHGLVLCFLTSIVVAVLGLLFSAGFFKLFTDDAAIISMGTQYLSICCGFSFASFLQISSEKILQATGNMMWPMVFQLVGAVSNIILDPILIFGYLGFPAMGVVGAAVATVAGQAIGMVIGFIVMLTGKHAIHITFKGFRFHQRTIKDIYVVGFPSIIMQSVGTVMMTGMNGILSSFSEAAYTVFGLYFKLQSFVFMPVFGLTQGLMPIMGFNYGARNRKRLVSTLKYGIMIALCINTLGMALFMSIPNRLIGIFSNTPEVIEIGTYALRVISMSFIMAAIGITMSTLFQAVGKGTYSLINSLLRQLVALLPIAYFLSKVSLEAVWWAYPIADFISLGVTVFLFFRLRNRTLKNLDKEEQPMPIAQETVG